MPTYQDDPVVSRSHTPNAGVGANEEQPLQRRRRTPGAAPNPDVGGAVQAHSPPPRAAALDASWEAIVEQLLATPSDPQPYEPDGRRRVRLGAQARAAYQPAPEAPAEVTRQAARQAQSVRQLRAALAARLGRGESLDGVERELIAHSRLSEEQQSALWLYGWSLPKHAPADSARPPRFWVTLGNALATFVGVCRH